MQFRHAHGALVHVGALLVLNQFVFQSLCAKIAGQNNRPIQEGLHARVRATTFIGEAFERSRCFRDGGATCVSCHNTHPDDAAKNQKSLKFAPDSDEMCLQCHRSLRDHPERHYAARLRAKPAAAFRCHMPRNMDALMFRSRSHQIDEIPDAEMTARFGEPDSPNACLACHRGKDIRWLVDSMAAWRPGR